MLEVDELGKCRIWKKDSHRCLEVFHNVEEVVI
jgi:hypothetical protein